MNVGIAGISGARARNLRILWYKKLWMFRSKNYNNSSQLSEVEK